MCGKLHCYLHWLVDEPEEVSQTLHTKFFCEESDTAKLEISVVTVHTKLILKLIS